MKKRRFFLIITFVLIWVWALLSIYGAFLGSGRAAEFFQSAPVGLFWFLWVFFLSAYFFLSPRAWTDPFLSMIHLGVLLVFAGGLWGSPKSIMLRNRMGGCSLIPKGFLVLSEQQEDCRVYNSQGQEVGRLPFELYLEKFDTFFYDHPRFVILDKTRPEFYCAAPVELEKSIVLEGGVQIEVIQHFRNLQIVFEAGKPAGKEGPPDHFNPGYLIRLQAPHGTQEYHHVWQRMRAPRIAKNRFEIFYQPPQWPRQYQSKLSIRQADHPVLTRSIEVNRPLFCKGYLFYQQSWGEDEKGRYSVIGVVHNSGLLAVFFGYGLLALGSAGHCWIQPFWTKVCKKERPHRD